MPETLSDFKIIFSQVTEDHSSFCSCFMSGINQRVRDVIGDPQPSSEIIEMEFKKKKQKVKAFKPLGETIKSPKTKDIKTIEFLAVMRKLSVSAA